MNRAMSIKLPMVGILALGFFQSLEVFAAPDILMIMPDQMRGDCLSILHHPVVQTPTLDRLAQEGVLFRRGYSPVPSCIPARYALLTGQSPQKSGVVGFQSRKILVPTLPKVLGDAGYSTVLVGRNMHQGQPEAEGYQAQFLGSTYVKDDTYDRYLKQEAPESGGIGKLIDDTGVTLNWWQANPWPLKDELHPTSWAIRQSEKVIADTPPGKPLFLTASFYSPHPPLFPPKKYFDPLLKKDLPKPAHGDWVQWDKVTTKGTFGGSRILLEGETLRRAQAGYYGLIEQIDTEIAPLIAAFKARSEKAGRPWVIVFTTDHGEMMGDHGYFRKCEAYEGSANIPFIITGSKDLGFKPGVRTNQAVALQDLMPTLLALAGVKPPPSMDGVNLLPALCDDAKPTRAILHFEHSPCYSAPQAFHALTDGHFKYIWRPMDGTEQLFNLDADPREEHDMSTVAADHDRLIEWRKQLIKRLVGRPEGFTDGDTLIAKRPYPAIMKGTDAK
jgi:arylsulfatase